MAIIFFLGDYLSTFFLLAGAQAFPMFFTETGNLKSHSALGWIHSGNLDY